MSVDRNRSRERIPRGSERNADLESMLQKFEEIRMWKDNGRPAAQKPLVVLLALAKLSRGQERISYREVDERLPKLVEQFLPMRPRPKPEQPFWRLRSDGVWKVDPEGRIRMTDKRDAFRSDLKKYDATGRFSEDVLTILKSDPRNIGILASQLLDSNFPTHRHQEILDAVGLDPMRTLTESRRLKRDPRFTLIVRKAYESRCCVCGYDLQFGGELTGLEAAHIQALYANGPDIVPNALLLCVVHHKAFDHGAFTIQDDGRTIECSREISGTSRLEWLTDFHGQRIAIPRNPGDRPRQGYLAWHREHAFLGASR